MYIVQSLVRSLVNSNGKRISKDALVALDKRVVALIDNAITLVPKNVKTIKPTEIAQAKG